MSDAAPVDLGSDVWLYAGEQQDHSLLAGRHRFLDHLWLPCACNDLTPAQIQVINRFREQRISSDDQFKHANSSRRAIVDALARISPSRVLEIGCGKFTLAHEIKSLVQYRAIDIDDEAIAFCKEQGLEVGRVADLPAPSPTFDVAIALYVFQFALNDELLDYIERALLPGAACIIFNAIADDTTILLEKLARLSKRWPVVEIVKSGQLARREFFFAIGGEADFDNVHFAASALREVLG